MLIPRFTIRTMLVITTVCAVLASTIYWARQGSAWAAALASGGALVIFVFFIYGVFFAVAFGLARLVRRNARPASRPVLGLEGDGDGQP